MADLPLSRGLIQIDSGGRDFSGSTLNSFLSGNNVKGAWSELIATTTEDSDHLEVILAHDDTGVEEFLFDLAIGPAGFEVLVIENMHWSGRPNESSPYAYHLPISIPVGSRVSTRARGTSSRSVKVGIDTFKGGFQSGSGKYFAQGYGINEGSERGTLVDPGLVANSKGAYSELVASTSESIFGFCLVIGNNDNTTFNADAKVLLDISIGSAGFEHTLIKDHVLYFFTTEIGNTVVWFDIDIPEGSRISARAQSTSINGTDRLFTVCLIGVN